MIKKLKKMEVIEPSTGSENRRKPRTEVLKVKSGVKIVYLTESGKTTKNMDLVFKFTEIKIVTKEAGCRT